MPHKTNCIDDMDCFARILIGALDEMTSLEDLYTWLKSQEWVDSVKMEGFLVKTNPPQREFVIQLKMSDGSIKTKVVDIYQHYDNTLKFRAIHDP